MEPLGLTDGQIPDFAITASSTFSDFWAPKNGRLYTVTRDGMNIGWRPKGNRIFGEWLQVDLGVSVTVTKIATQGHVHVFVKSYTLAYSRDGESFEYYKEVHG